MVDNVQSVRLETLGIALEGGEERVDLGTACLAVDVGKRGRGEAVVEGEDVCRREPVRCHLGKNGVVLLSVAEDLDDGASLLEGVRASEGVRRVGEAGGASTSQKEERATVSKEKSAPQGKVVSVDEEALMRDQGSKKDSSLGQKVDVRRGWAIGLEERLVVQEAVE